MIFVIFAMFFFVYTHPCHSFAILGTTMSVNVATQEGDHGCYLYSLIYAIKPNLGKYLSNMNEFN